MKKLSFILLVVSLVGCVMPPKWRESLDPDEKSIVYINTHEKLQNDAYVSAHSWIAKNYNSAHDVIQMQDKEAGMLIVKAGYPFAYPVDPPINSVFLSGFVNYTLSITVKDKKIKFEFITGPVSGQDGARWNGTYLPKDKMPGLLAHYINIHEEMMREILSGKSDF